MIDRRFFFFCAIVLAFGFLALIGLTPPVLWQKAQDFAASATGAATKTGELTREREKRGSDEVGTILDGLPGADEKKTEPRRRHP